MNDFFVANQGLMDWFVRKWTADQVQSGLVKVDVFNPALQFLFFFLIFPLAQVAQYIYVNKNMRSLLLFAVLEKGNCKPMNKA